MFHKSIPGILFISSFILFLFLSPQTLSAKSLRGQVEEVISLYQDGATTKALQKASSLLKDTSRFRGKRNIKGKLYLYLGIIFFEENKKSLAAQSFLKAYHLAPHLKLLKEQKPLIYDFIRNLRSNETKTLDFQKSLGSSVAKPSKTSPLMLTGVAFAALSVIALTAGITSGMMAQQTHEKSQELVAQARKENWREVVIGEFLKTRYQPRIEQDSLVANISYGVAGATAVTAAVMIALSLRKGTSDGIALNKKKRRKKQKRIASQKPPQNHNSLTLIAGER